MLNKIRHKNEGDLRTKELNIGEALLQKSSFAKRAEFGDCSSKNLPREHTLLSKRR